MIADGQVLTGRDGRERGMMLNAGKLAAALAAWRAASLGISVDPVALEEANQATFAAPSEIVAVLSPTTAEDVANCLRIATRFGIPVHPASRGCNWGYGSRLPSREQAVLLSLKRMRRVLRFDADMATIRIEPGVTFLDLAQYLAATGSRLLPPTTGSGPHTSIVGNILERGIGKGLYEDMAAHACGFEVVLPTAERVNTGPVAPAQLAGAVPVASGPGLRGLFVQSNLGVVTAADLWLHRAPQYRQIVWAFLPSGAALAGCIDQLRPLLQRGDPWLRAELVTQQRAASQGVTVGTGWIAIIRVWGDAAADLALRRQTALDVLTQAGGLAAEAGAVEDGAGFDMDGAGLQSAYSAKPGGMPADPDPDRDRCGVRWVAPSLPMRGAMVAGATDAVATILGSHGFPAAISLRNATGRAIHAVVGLFYDRDEQGGDARAADCSAALHAWLRANHLAPYRLGILEMAGAADDEGPGRQALLRSLKQAVDPAGILSPGRYIH